MYIIARIDGFLCESAFATDREQVVGTVRNWFNMHRSDDNDEGYIAVEEASTPGKVARRIIQLNLDASPGEAEEVLNESYENMTILRSRFVEKELQRIQNAPLDFDGRDVEADIEVLKGAITTLNDFLNGDDDVVIVECNMWDECHDSLDRVLDHYSLAYNDEKSDYESYQFAIERK
ncbi:hypothetical protein IMZ31_24225 (plasmid) [Pontibacillus sp. ALD_SL1]|uniref:hypothetical protein n=1 Tax=Pontibacillus sp. ALD_SL1 TaxID=2777185 RepID=UPI001A96D061|nr:hypothetical protein [Pontibacillus sp. ALD_SL1]QST02560.1 hypothetical protein IMZ31_24225 [Pontibacillus sp. ALD_SL1]